MSVLVGVLAEGLGGPTSDVQGRDQTGVPYVMSKEPYSKAVNIFTELISFRLMVNLTQPAILCFQNQIPQDKATRNFYMEVENDLQSYKEVSFLPVVH